MNDLYNEMASIIGYTVSPASCQFSDISFSKMKKLMEAELKHTGGDEEINYFLKLLEKIYESVDLMLFSGHVSDDSNYPLNIDFMKIRAKDHYDVIEIIEDFNEENYEKLECMGFDEIKPYDTKTVRTPGEKMLKLYWDIG